MTAEGSPSSLILAIDEGDMSRPAAVLGGGPTVGEICPCCISISRRLKSGEMFCGVGGGTGCTARSRRSAGRPSVAAVEWW